MSSTATEREAREPSHSLAKPQKGIPALRGTMTSPYIYYRIKMTSPCTISTNIFFGTVMQSIGPKNTQR